jgi:hypothetical protein
MNSRQGMIPQLKIQKSTEGKRKIKLAEESTLISTCENTIWTTSTHLPGRPTAHSKLFGGAKSKSQLQITHLCFVQYQPQAKGGRA